MLPIRHLATALIVSALAAGCYGEGRVSYVATTPDLAYVGPGVYVVADYDDPVFYADHFYWRYDGGVWYRSRVHTGGWTVTTHVPVAVRHIDHPAAYAHYHGRRHPRGHVRGHDHASRDRHGHREARDHRPSDRDHRRR